MLQTIAPMKETILRFRVPATVAQRLEDDARRMGLRVAEVARFRLAEAVTVETSDAATDSVQK